MKKYLVIGNPINHSLSPKLHNYWIKKNNINAVYEKKKVNEKSNPILDSLTEHAIKFFKDKLKPNKVYKKPSEQEKKGKGVQKQTSRQKRDLIPRNGA